MYKLLPSNKFYNLSNRYKLLQFEKNILNNNIYSFILFSSLFKNNKNINNFDEIVINFINKIKKNNLKLDNLIRCNIYILSGSSLKKINNNDYDKSLILYKNNNKYSCLVKKKNDELIFKQDNKILNKLILEGGVKNRSRVPFKNKTWQSPSYIALKRKKSNTLLNNSKSPPSKINKVASQSTPAPKQSSPVPKQSSPASKQSSSSSTIPNLINNNNNNNNIVMNDEISNKNTNEIWNNYSLGLNNKFNDNLYYTKESVDKFLIDNIKYINDSNNNFLKRAEKYKEIIIASFTNEYRSDLHMLLHNINNIINNRIKYDNRFSFVPERNEIIVNIVVSGGTGINNLFKLNDRTVSPDIDSKLIILSPSSLYINDIYNKGNQYDKENDEKLKESINNFHKQLISVRNILDEELYKIAEDTSDLYKKTKVGKRYNLFEKDNMIFKMEDIYHRLYKYCMILLKENDIEYEKIDFFYKLNRDNSNHLKFTRSIDKNFIQKRHNVLLSGYDFSHILTNKKTIDDNDVKDIKLRTNQVLLYSLDLTFENVDFFKGLSGIIDITIVLPNHIGFFKDIKEIKMNYRGSIINIKNINKNNAKQDINKMKKMNLRDPTKDLKDSVRLNTLNTVVSSQDGGNTNNLYNNEDNILQDKFEEWVKLNNYRVNKNNKNKYEERFWNTNQNDNNKIIKIKQKGGGDNRLEAIHQKHVILLNQVKDFKLLSLCITDVLDRDDLEIQKNIFEKIKSNNKSILKYNLGNTKNFKQTFKNNILNKYSQLPNIKRNFPVNNDFEYFLNNNEVNTNELFYSDSTKKYYSNDKNNMIYGFRYLRALLSLDVNNIKYLYHFYNKETSVFDENNTGFIREIHYYILNNVVHSIKSNDDKDINSLYWKIFTNIRSITKVINN